MPLIIFILKKCQNDKSVTCVALPTAHQVNQILHQPMSEGLKYKNTKKPQDYKTGEMFLIIH